MYILLKLVKPKTKNVIYSGFSQTILFQGRIQNQMEHLRWSYL